MKYKKIIGWTILLAISFLPILPWYFFRPETDLSSYANFTHAIGQLTGLIGMTMFALTFMLSTRMRFIEDLFGGLDKVYVVHKILGATSLILILFHPIFLVLKYVPSNMELAAKYLLPFDALAVDLGIIALLVMIILIFVSFYFKIRYQIWKFSHEFLGLAFILALLHIILVRGIVSRDYIFEGYYAYVIIVGIIGLSGFIYGLIIKRRLNQYEYKVDNVILKNDIYDITMSPESNPMKYKSGQFIFLKFYSKKLTKEPHPFSIASSSSNPKVRVVVKNLGDYTSRLSELKKGDKVMVEGPYGRFNYARNHADQVWIAGGIGITPFIGMAEDLKGKKNKNQITLFYSVRQKDDFIALEQFRAIEKSTDTFKIVPWATSEHGRLTIENIIKETGKLKNKEFYLCGPKEFKNSLTNALIQQGASKSKIYSEEFEFK